MRAEDVREILNREPFNPLKLVKTDGKSLPIKFRRSLVAMKTFVIVFKGIESATSSFAKEGFEEFPYENIARLEPIKARGRGNGKKNGKNGGGPK